MISNVVHDFLRILQAKIERADVDNALALARLYGNIAWNNPVGIYRACDVEDVVFQKLEHVMKIVTDKARPARSANILHVLTEGYTSGGHTRVLERLVTSAKADVGQDVVVVELCPGEVVRKFTEAGSSVKQVVGTGAAAVAELAVMMTEYDSVILHIHPDDIVSSMAARISRAMGIKVAFYNHADHCFTFGIDSSNVLCEIGAYGRAVSEAHRTEMTWTFAGIPLDVVSTIPAPRSVKDYVLSSGPAYKFDFSEGGIFSSIVDGVLAEPGARMVVVGAGRLPVDASRTLVDFVGNGRLVLTPQISHASYTGYLAACRCYVDSAPVTGGSALPEAALLGIPCAGLVNPVMGYSPVDAVRSKSVADVVARIRSLYAGTKGSSEISRDLLIFAHSPTEVLRRILTNLDTGAVVDIPATMTNKSIDIGSIHEQWKRKNRINIHNRAFDYISKSQRLHVGVLMLKYRILGYMKAIDVCKVMVSNFRTRRMRNHHA